MTDKQMGMGEGPVPWSSIDRYCTRYKIEGVHYELFLDLIMFVDAVSMDMRDKKQEKMSNAKAS